MPYQQNAILQKIIAQKLVNLASARVELCGKSILDVGCGTGFVAQNLALQGVNPSNILQVDKNAASLQIAKQFGEVEIGDFNNPFSMERKFDTVFSSMALQWAEDFSKALQYLKARLSQQGNIFLAIPLNDSLSEVYKVLKIEPFKFPNIEDVDAKLMEVKTYTENGYAVLKNIHGAGLVNGSGDRLYKNQLILLKKILTKWKIGFFEICKA